MRKYFLKNYSILSHMLIRPKRTEGRALAFTLAEVLITLGIIGFVAAMTIPTLVNNYQKKETLTRLQKAYSILSQAFLNAQTISGQSSDWDNPTIETDSTASTDWWNEYFLSNSNLSIMKTCSSSNFSECWASDTKRLDGADLSINSSYQSLVLKDGTALVLYYVNNNDARIFVDINGLKKPNIVGKDIFYIYILYKSGKMVFCGYNYDRNTLLVNCNKSLGNSGVYCGSLIQKDGWQIKDDYPW